MGAILLAKTWGGYRGGIHMYTGQEGAWVYRGLGVPIEWGKTLILLINNCINLQPAFIYKESCNEICFPS